MNKSEMQSSCFVMGLGSLCIRCTEHLLADGRIAVRGVISADDDVIRWAKSRGLETLHIRNKVRYSLSKSEIDAFLTRSQFDYFFSIINAMFVPESVVRLPRRYAINFHDSELPKYAGIDVTSWAIMRRERQHGVTWHLMSDTIDQGDILKQVHVPIEKDETAFTLNTKCLETGFTSFKELIDDICLDRLQRRRQSPEIRTYYSRSKPHLPEMSIWTHGIVSWRWSAEEIEALTRALDYGPSRNALGTAKILIDQDFYILPSVTVCSFKSNADPGTVVHNSGKALQISTSSRDVLVSDLLTIEGRPISIADISARHGFGVNARLGEMPVGLLSRLKELDKDCMWKEAYWTNAFKSYRQIRPVRLNGGVSRANRRQGEAVEVRLSGGTRRILLELAEANDLDVASLLFGCFSSCLAMLCRSDVVPVWVSDGDYRRDVAGMSKLFSAFALCNTRFDRGLAIVEHCKALKEDLLRVKRQRYFLFDIAYRYPDLRGGLSLDELRQFAFSSYRDGDEPVDGRGFDLCLEVVEHTGSFTARIQSATGDPEDGLWFAEHFSAYVDAIVANPELLT